MAIFFELYFATFINMYYFCFATTDFARLDANPDIDTRAKAFPALDQSVHTFKFKDQGSC